MKRAYEAYREPCRSDAAHFSCAECFRGAVEPCRYRSDPTLRSLRAAYSSRMAGLGGISREQAQSIFADAFRVARETGLALPASVIRRRMPNGFVRKITDKQFAILLRSSGAFRETSPGMFRVVRGWRDAARFLMIPPLDLSSGASIERLVARYAPLPSDEQRLLFKSLRALELIARVAPTGSAPAALAAIADSVRDSVLLREGWSIARAHELATSGRALRPLDSDDPSAQAQRTTLLVALLGLELVRTRPPTQCAVDVEELRQKLLLHNLALVAAQVRRTSAGGFLQCVDFFQAGALGLHRAVEKFDAFKGYEFSTYAGRWIQQKMGRLLADEESLVRMPVHAFDARRKAGKPTYVYEPLACHPNIAVFESAVERTIDRERLQEMIRRDVLPLIAGRTRTVIELRFGLNGSPAATLEEVGVVLGLTRERIRQIEAKVLARLRSGRLGGKLREYWDVLS